MLNNCKLRYYSFKLWYYSCRLCYCSCKLQYYSCKLHNDNCKQQYYSGQSYKHFTLVNYDPRGEGTRELLILRL